jgi:hypothetical protein
MNLRDEVPGTLARDEALDETEPGVLLALIHETRYPSEHPDSLLLSIPCLAQALFGYPMVEEALPVVEEDNLSHHVPPLLLGYPSAGPSSGRFSARPRDRCMLGDHHQISLRLAVAISTVNCV